jgi:Tfp pilus assembly protein PilF
VIQIIGCCLGFLIAGSAQAQFLDFSQPARAAALGGNLVAMPEGSSALAFNPAGLALQDRFEASARYEAMFQGIENDSLSTGNIALLTSPDSFGAVGGAWDHLGSSFIQQDRFSLDWGRKFPGDGFFQHTSVGFSLSYMTERYVLTQPLSGVSLSQLSASAFGFGVGLLIDLPLNLTFGLSADNLNQPNLGVVGADRLPALGRWGLAVKFLNDSPIRLTVTAAQSLSDADLETQGGVEIFFPDYGVRLRAGLGAYQGAVGAGFQGADFFIDYAYLFSVSPDSQLAGLGLPGSHLLELGMRWGSPLDESEYGKRLQKAREAETTGQWDQALWYYQEMLALKPGDKTALEGSQRSLLRFNHQRADKYYQDGLSAEQKGSLAGARDNFEMASRLDPSNSFYSKALSRTTPKFPKEPLNSFPPSTQTTQLLATQADLYLSKGRPDLAKKNLEEALKDQPQNAELKVKLARLESPPRTVPPARAELAQRLYDKGLQNYLAGDLDGAIRAWEDSLRADPSQTKAQNNLIHARLEKEQEKP